ncbi:hypothetical protein OGATHE_001108 [Ogataea polymorpha]|uniref:Uncharacterized protein n=1 Tax=Ogataea polymorpha TaxID=460523 RepID=A0A9P8PSQ4_9ASCO|nr:hypothetical protein OGATHE_001108 [Ogataea polymorpha]
MLIHSLSLNLSTSEVVAWAALLDRPAGERRKNKHDGGHEPAQNLELRAPEPGKQRGQVPGANPEPNDVEGTNHARGPRVGYLLLNTGNHVDDQRAARGLDDGDGEVQNIDASRSKGHRVPVDGVLVSIRQKPAHNVGGMRQIQQRQHRGHTASDDKRSSSAPVEVALVAQQSDNRLAKSARERAGQPYEGKRMFGDTQRQQKRRGLAELRGPSKLQGPHN